MPLIRAVSLLAVPFVFAGGCDTPTAAPTQPVAPAKAEVEAEVEAGPADPGPAMPAPGESGDSDPSDPVDRTPIGSVTMKEDGTLELMLRAETGDAVGHGFFVYAPDHPEYASTLAHVGPIEPGESKPVPPWPDPKPDAPETK